jgi:hypothetical protein
MADQHAPPDAPSVAPPDALDRANERFRDAAKWLVASAAAVGAALIAGSQVSSIGRLPLGWPTSDVTARLWVALLGTVLGLAAVVYAMWTAVRVLVPASVLVGDLDDAWNRTGGPLGPVVAFFRRHDKYLQGFASPAEIIAARARLIGALDAARITARTNEIADLDARIAAIERMANHEALKERFRGCLRRLVGAAAVAAVGIVAFAWAANPPVAGPPSADLRGARLVGTVMRDADLRGARLDHADLTAADLTGADLAGASIVGVRWANTTCPDGSNSDAVGGTCAGHLS